MAFRKRNKRYSRRGRMAKRRKKRMSRKTGYTSRGLGKPGRIRLGG